MRKVFNNEALENRLCERGWVKIQLLSSSEVNRLIQFYKEHENFQKSPGLHFSLASEDYNFRSNVNEIIAQAFNARVQALFKNYKMLYGNFMVKEPGAEGNFPLHQDWTYVNEPQFRSIAVWVALTDNNEQTGCLHVIEQSHLWGDTPRGPGLSWKFENVAEQLRTFLLPLPLKAGEALIWDHRLIHASNPNCTQQARIGATAIYIPEEAQAFHFVKNQDAQDNTYKHTVNSEFFLRYTMKNLSDLNIPAVEKLPVQHIPYSLLDLEKILSVSS